MVERRQGVSHEVTRNPLMLVRLLALFLFVGPVLADAPDRPALLKRMEEVMGPLPDKAKKAPLDVQIASEEKLDGYIRKKLTYVADAGDRVPAYLLIPAEFKGKRPAALCL